jgi:chromosome segregation ATPase
MKKYLLGSGTMAVGAGLVFVLMHGEVVFGQEASNTDSKSDAALELRDQRLLKVGEKKKRFARRKGKVLDNIGERRALLNNFESCVKSANSHEDLKSCRNKNKKRMEALHAERKKIKAQRENRRKEMEAFRADENVMNEKMKAKREKLRKEMEALRAEEKAMREKMKAKRGQRGELTGP